MNSKKIQENWEKALMQLRAACERAHREPNSVRILSISKRQSIETILAAHSVGINVFGENYPEEADEKIRALKDYPEIRWEMVGHIQSRKAALVANPYQMIHSLDSLKLARRLNQFRNPDLAPLPCLLQINIAGEDEKSGYKLVTSETSAVFYSELELILQLPKLKLTGLMTMAPLQDNPELNRPHFRSLRLLMNALNERYGLNLSELSMGTTSDYIVAAEEGATVVRLGEAILGKRNYEVQG